MNRVFKIIFVLSLMPLLCCSAQEKNADFEWNIEKERIHNKNRMDSTKRSIKNWKADIEHIKMTGTPMMNGVFPVPDYDLADSTFNGIGNGGEWAGIPLNDKTIIYHSLFVNQSDVNREFIPNKPNEVFFTILALTDTIDTKRLTHTDVSSISRNHPHYTGQGYIKTKSNRIDFVAFLTADRNQYALVNMRLFDLRIGRIILIAPKIDGTMRSLQLETPIMSSDEMDKYVKELMSDKKVVDFFTKFDNI